uniref:Uncharacterized protein n=1 Tax=Arundo donax TaxID=35708 RepID=A0A0A8YLR0_ARUDO
MLYSYDAANIKPLVEIDLSIPM